MEETQSFRIAGTTDIETIDVDNVDGQNIIYWEDIEQVFPGVRHIRNGSTVVKLLRDSNRTRIVPHCIKHYPGVVLDIISSTTVEHALVNSPIAISSLAPADSRADTPADAQTDFAISNAPPINAPANSPANPPTDALILATTENKFVEALQVTSTSVEASTSNTLVSTMSTTLHVPSKTALSFRQIVKLASKKEHECGFQELNVKMARMIKLQEAFDAKQEEFNRQQNHSIDQQEEIKQLQEQVLNNQEEMKQLQQRAFDQLAVLQSRVQAVLTQNYELHEYPIPRLFVVLPQDPSGWDAVNPFSNKLRLYFLCECGEHTKSISGKTKISHDIHFAKHEGYEIVRPSEFFQQYGPYVLTILKMLKFGVSVAGVAVPAISHLVSSDAIDQATADLQQLRDNIEPGIDHVIDWMDKVSVNEGEAIDEFAKQMEKNEALEGADLRKLDTFLKDKDGNKVLGNLYRTVTDEGHVKWVCIDHYRVNYQETSATEFLRVLDSVGGSFSEKVGRVEVRLRSGVLAEQFFSALGKARSVYELDIDLDWACATRDLEALEEALKKSRVSILRLHLRQFRTGVASKLLSTSTQYDVIFRIRDLPNMKVLHFVVAKELMKFLGFTPKKSTHACKISCELASGRIEGKEFGILAKALKTNSTLTTLDLQSNSIRSGGAKALAEALKTNLALTTLHLHNNSIGNDGAKALAEALKTNSTLTTLDLQSNSIRSDGAEALAEALKTNSVLTTLDLQNNSIGDDGAKVLAEALKTNSTLTTLHLHNNSIGNDGAKALVEALKTNMTVTISR